MSMCGWGGGGGDPMGRNVRLHSGQERQPPFFFIDRRITKRTGNKEIGAGKGRGRGSGSGQNTSCTGSTSRRHEPQRRDLRSRVHHRYGWIPHNASSGFLDRPRAILGRIHLLDWFGALQLMDCPPLLWIISKSKYFRFYEVASN
jgi:hypothetical protein